MTEQAFIEWNPRRETIAIVAMCRKIVAEYQAQDLRLTLRQLFYQFVSRDLIPNTERSYKNLGSIVGKARMAGLLDWAAIEDRGREPDIPSEFDGIEDLVDVALRSYRLDRWAGQSSYVELWVEKAALAGVLEPMARRYHVTLMVNKGYSSLSAMYESAQRIRKNARRRNAVVLYLGDHDPSGEDMVRDIRDRLRTFGTGVVGVESLRVQKIALTMDQIEEYDPPPNPTKVTDSRARAYIERYGHECWEVDALDPRTLQQLIADAIEEELDREMMDEIIEQENTDKQRLQALVEDAFGEADD